MRSRRPGQIAFFLLLTTTGILIWQVAQRVQTYETYPPDFDEAVHLLPVLQVANAIQRSNGEALWQAIIQQDQLASYPFVHSLLSAPAWLLRPSITTMRVMSLLYVGGAVALAFVIAAALAQHTHWSWLAGLLSGGTVLASFPLWIYGSLAYLEGAGLLVTMLAVWCYVQGLQTKRPFFLIAASLTTALVFFTKYNFGLFLVGGIGLNEAVQLALNYRRYPWQRAAYVAGPAALLLLLWFADVDHLARFLSFSNAQQGHLDVTDWKSWTYYPSSFARQYLVWPSFLLTSLGVIWTVFRWRVDWLRFFLIYTLVSWLLLVAVPQKAPRFIYTIAPVTFLPAGAMMAETAVWLQRQKQQWQWLALIAAIVWVIWWATAVAHRFSFLDPGLEIAYDSVPETAVGYRFVWEQTTGQTQPVVMLNGWHLFNPLSLQWSFHAAHGYPSHPVDYHWIGNELALQPTPGNLAHLLATWRRQGVEYVVSIDGSPAGDYTGWDVVEPLLAQRALTPIASSGEITIYDWDDDYRERVLAGAFPSLVALRAIRPARRSRIVIRLHLYRLQYDQ